MIPRILISMVVAICTAMSISMFQTVADLYQVGIGNIPPQVTPPESLHQRIADLTFLLLTPSAAIITFFFLLDDKEESYRSSDRKRPEK